MQHVSPIPGGWVIHSLNPFLPCHFTRRFTQLSFLNSFFCRRFILELIISFVLLQLSVAVGLALRSFVDLLRVVLDVEMIHRGSRPTPPAGPAADETTGHGPSVVQSFAPSGLVMGLCVSRTSRSIFPSLITTYHRTIDQYGG